MNETDEGRMSNNQPLRMPLDQFDQGPPQGEEPERTGLRVAVAVAVVILVLFGLYWGGKLLLMPDEGGTPEGPEGLEVSLESKCSSPIVYTDIDSALGNPEAVCKIDLSGQGLTSLSPYIGYFTNLVELDISDNNIGWLPSEIGWLRKLQKFDASNNKLTALALEIGWLRALKEWNLSNNQITGLPSEIGWLREMEYLNLANNQISYVPLELGWMGKMKELNLAGNVAEVASSAERLRPYMSGASIVLP